MPGRLLYRLAIAIAVVACSGKPRAKPPLEIYKDGVALERRANQDPRRTREAVYDDALAHYAESCAGGHTEACERRDELDRMLRERRGVCDTPEGCLEQATLWLPNLRGEERLRALCLGEPMKFEYGTPPEPWPPDGRACIAVAEFYRSAGRAEPATFYFDKGCVEASLAVACRGGGQTVIDDAHALDDGADTRGKSAALRHAAEKLARGCELEDSESCRLLSRVALARQRLRFPDGFSLRYADEDGDPRAHLGEARKAAERACGLAGEDPCAQLAEVDAEIERVEGILKMGCAFLDDCAAGEICNRKSGLCESSEAKGAFYKAYERGIKSFDKRDYDGARKAFEQARAMNKALAGPWRWLGLIAQRQKRHAECVELLDEALRLNPRSRYSGGMQRVRDKCQAAAPKK